MADMATVRKTQLTGIDVHEVSFVREGANGHALIQLRKEQSMIEKMKAAVAKLKAAVEKHAANPAAAPEVTAAIVEINDVAKEHLTEGTVDVKKALTDCSDEEVAAEMAARKARTSALKKSADEAAAAAAPPPAAATVQATVTKSAEALLIEKQATELADIKKQVDTLTSERDHSVLVNKAKDMLGDVSDISPDELATILKSLDPKSAEAMERVLKGANEIKKTAPLYLVRGDAGAKPGTASEAINKSVAEIQKNDPKISDAMALEKALLANPELYDAYDRENPAQKVADDE